MHLESTPTWLIGPQIPPTERIGTVLSGSYRLDAFLGQGMTGITYNAWHLRQKQPYAVKLLHRELQPSHERVSRLRQDLRTLSGLRRFGFLPVELSFAPDGAPFLACELLTGETLRSRLSHGPLPVLAAGIVTAALARALGEAHQQGIVHGDLRPENVLLPSEAGREVEAGQPVLVDAALHHLRRRPIGLDESLPIGKLVYLAPEQASGEQSTADASGDLFALGAILYECLTGQQAFAAPELEVVLEKLAAPPKKLVLPREVGAPPGLSEALDEVIAKACARDPADRYATMAELLQALDKAFAKAGLPLPPPDERVSIDTVKAQNRELRKRTVMVKKVVPLAPMTEMPETSGVMSAAAFANLSALMTSSSTPEPSEPAAAASKPEGADAAAAAEKPAEGRRITAKNRIVRRTVRARDLSRLLKDIESGKLDVTAAMELAEKTENEPEPEDAAVPEPVGDNKSEAQRIIDQGRAAVIARAEAAKKNRETETKERQQRDQALAQEMQRRLLEQARQETLGRMRAEWEQSRPMPKVSAKELAEAAPRSDAPDPQQAELLAEAQRQKQRLEAERLEAERRAAEQAEKARAEAKAAEAARLESARLEAELRAAERREAERAEAVRRQAELEAEARRQAEEAEKARAAKQAEAETRHREAEAARQAAEAKQRVAAAAKQAVETAVETREEAALWADTFDLLLEDDKPDRTIPPPIPAAALRARTEAARRAEAEAERAQAEAAAAAAAAQQARSDAAEIEQQVVVARRAEAEAAAAREREAAELAAAVEAAEDVRAQDQALFRQVMEAEQRAKVAEAARVANVALMTRVTQALQVIRQVQTFVDEEPAGDAVPSGSTTSVDTGRFLRPATRPEASGQAAPVGAAPSGPLSSEITGRTAVPTPSANAQSAPETSSGYAAFQISHAARDASGAQAAGQPLAGGARVDAAAQSGQNFKPVSGAASAPILPAPADPRMEGSASYSAAQMAAAGIRPEPPGQGFPNAQSAQTAQPVPGPPGGSAPSAPRVDLSAAYAAAQMAAAGVRPEQSTGYTAAQMAVAGVRDPSMSYPAAQMAAGVRDPSMSYSAAQMAAGVRTDPSMSYAAAQMAAGVRDPSMSYSAAQLAAAGHSVSQAMALQPGQQLPSGMHPALAQHMGSQSMVIVPAGGRPEGDVSAIMTAGGPMLVSTSMVQMLPGQAMPAPPPPETGGVTLTTRQLVATLSMTAVLSGVIGALIALLVTQNTYKPSEPGAGAGGSSSVSGQAADNPGAGASPAPHGGPAGDSPGETPPPPAVDSPAGQRPAAAVQDRVPDTLVLQRGGASLPPLRLASVAAVGPPRQSQWTRPGGAARTPAPPAAGAKPGPAAPAPTTAPTPAAKPPGAAPAKPAPTKPAADSTPATDAKTPGAPGKPAAKPGADDSGLRNPFHK
mgnify:CR=1 FL=1